jgi:hypothetical protein
MGLRLHLSAAQVHGGTASGCLSFIKPVMRGARTMNTRPMPLHAGYELRFQSLFDEGRAYAFPCDAAGHVDMDRLSDRARQNYLYARTVVGREVAMPAVRVSVLH